MDAIFRSRFLLIQQMVAEWVTIPHKRQGLCGPERPSLIGRPAPSMCLLIFGLINLAVVVFAVIVERKPDPRFGGEKINYRS